MSMYPSTMISNDQCLTVWTMNRYEGSRFTAKADQPACLLISGWGLSSQVFDLILPSLALQFDVYTLDRHFTESDLTLEQVSGELKNLLIQFSEKTKKNFWLMGWSLGGNIALKAAADALNQGLTGLEGLFLVGTSPKFIAEEGFSQGVQSADFQQVQTRLLKNKTRALAYFDRLQVHGDKDAQTLISALKSLRAVEPELSDKQLASELDWLFGVDQRELLSSFKKTVYWFFGEKDGLASADIAAWIKNTYPKMMTFVIEGASHPVFLSKPEPFLTQLDQCLYHESHQYEKMQMANRFSKAAVTYDSFARLQQLVGEKLFARNRERQFDQMLDAGCGTGFFSESLTSVSQQVLGVDLAAGMVDYAKQNHSSNALWIQGDIEVMPFKPQSLDGIFSSLAVQWVESLSGLLKEWYRLLSPGGEVFISTLGPKSLFELRQSFEAIDQFQHVNQFLSFDAIQAEINASEFEVIEACQTEEILSYPSCLGVMKDLKGIGATLIKGKHAKGLMTKERLEKLAEAYDEYKQSDGTIPATYEVIYLHLKKVSAKRRTT